jgi:hypothetical protein
MEYVDIDADPTVGATTVSKELDAQNRMKSHVTLASLTEYDFLSMAYCGDRFFRDGSILRPHAREFNEDYIARREMAFLKNFLKPVVNARIDPVFSVNIPRESQDDAGEKALTPLFDSFLEDCDGQGSAFGDFIEETAREANLQSLCFLVVDNYKDVTKSKALNVAERLHPYVYRQNRNTLVDYSCDGRGKLQWIRFFDHVEKTPDGHMMNFYRLWNSTQSILQKKDSQSKDAKYIDVETTEHGLGKIPVYAMAFISKRDSKDMLSVDYEFYDLARCNWTVYNLDSATMEAIFGQCFSLLCIQGEKKGDGRTGIHTILWVDRDVSNMPMYLSPSPEVAKLSSDYADKIKMEIFAIAEQNGVTATKGVIEQSGKAKEWDFQAHGFILKKIAKACRKAEEWVAEIYSLYTGEQFNYVARYKEDFAIRDSDVLIKVQESILLNDFGPEAKALARKNISYVAFNHNSETEVKRVIDEIDNMKNDEANASDVTETTKREPIV